MTAASTSNPRQSDDLTDIAGIGPARATLLRESLDVYTFQDLAALSVDEIKSQLRAEGQFVSEDVIEQWIAQARVLADATVEAEHNSPNSEPAWESAATFVVEFQVQEDGEERRTRVHHMEEDVDADWPDVRPVEVSLWMLEQMGEPASGLPEAVEAQARQELERELQQMRADARQELRAELDAERERRRSEMERELEEQHAEDRQALQQELQEMRARAERELDEELEAERARLQREMQQSLEERRAEAEQALEQELQQTGKAAREELREDLEAERARRRSEIEQELQEWKAEAQRSLQEELQETRAKAHEELDEELEAERARQLQAMERDMQRMRAEVREPVEEAPEPEQPEEEVVSEAEPEVAVEVAAERELVAVARPSAFEVEVVYIRQPPEVETPRVVGKSPTSPDVFRSERPFSLTACFRLDAAEANELARKGATYTVQFHARDISTGAVQTLGTSHPEEYRAGKAEYEATLTGVTLPSGVYRLTAFVSAGTTPPGGAYGQVATLLMT
ncbi:MAG: helix-hairpin-helix domain-containing protein [Chloroflexota bacterium]